MDAAPVPPSDEADRALDGIKDKIRRTLYDVQLALLDKIYDAPNPFAAIPDVRSFIDHVTMDDGGVFSPTTGIEVLAELIAVDLLEKAQPETVKETVRLANNIREFSDQYARALFRSTRSTEANLLYNHTTAVLLEHALIQLADLALENEGNPRFNIDALVDYYGTIRTQCTTLTGEEPKPAFVQHEKTRNSVHITNPNHIYFGDEVVYWAGHRSVVEGIIGSFRDVLPKELATNRYIGWFESRLSKLASLPIKTGYKETNITTELENLVGQHAGLIGEVISETRRIHQALYVAFNQIVQRYSRKVDDETRKEVYASLVALVDITRKYSRILNIDLESSQQEVQRTLQFNDINFDSMLQAQAPDPAPAPMQSKVPQTASPADEQANSVEYARPQEREIKPPLTWLDEVAKIGSKAVAVAATAAVAYLAYSYHAKREAIRPLTMKEQVASLPPSKVHPVMEAAYVQSFHHAPHREVYLRLRRAEWCPTQEALEGLVRPFKNGTRSTWEQIHAKRAELLRAFATDQTYACRR